jgi:hypothetical protein
LKRLKESDDKIFKSIKMLRQFVKQSNSGLTYRLLEILNTQNIFINSFDCYHLAFAETSDCKKIITFDKDFNKFNTISKIEINILKTED